MQEKKLYLYKAQRLKNIVNNFKNKTADECLQGITHNFQFKLYCSAFIQLL